MNSKQQRSLLYLFMLLGLLPAFGIWAQEPTQKDCKARVKANRKSLFRFNTYKAIGSEYWIEEKIIKVIYKDTLDSAYIYQPDKQLVAALQLQKNGLINSPVSLGYVANGLRLTDSIVPHGGKRKLNSYFEGLLFSHSVLWTANDNAGTKIYYGIGGQDSLRITNLKEDGHEMTWYSSGLDSLTKRWNDAGSLVYERTLTSEKIWDGKLQLIRHTFDSLVQHKWRVRCQKNWYPTGNLSSVSFHYLNAPCLTWKYYNEQGKLIRTVKHKALKGTPVEYGVGIVPREEMVFRSVYQKEAVDVVFNKALNDRLAALLCQTNVALEGFYTLEVYVMNSGTFIFKDIEGANADAIRTELAAFFNGLEKVKPAVMNGQPFTRLLQLTLEVKAKDK